MPIAPLLLLALAVSPPLAAAAKHLKAGQLEELAFDLSDGAKLTPADGPEAARLLSEGAARAQKAGDAPLALQLAQTGHRRDPRQPEALRLLAELALADQRFTAAEQSADALLALAPSEPKALLLRARIAEAEGDPEQVQALLAPLRGSPPPGEAERRELAELQGKAAAALAGQQAQEAGRLQQAEQLHAAAERAARAREEAFARQDRPAAAGSVVIYGTSWCAFCAKARNYFKGKGIAFSDRDVEQDPAAAAELRAKEEQAGMEAGGGVPVIDVYGTLVQGYDPRRLDWLLQQRGQ